MPVIASEAKQSPLTFNQKGRDCFVAKPAPRNDNGQAVPHSAGTWSMLALIFLSFALLLSNPALAQHKDQQRHRGPADLKEYIEILEQPERDKEQKPDEVIKVLNLDQYMTIADIGAGSGYFTRKFVWAVQDKGMVYAVDIEPGMLKYNEEMVEHLHTPYNAKFIVAKEDDPLLPPKSVDLIFLCNTYHHLEKRADYFARAKTALTKKGRVAIIDFYHDERSGNLGFSKDHLIPRDTVVKEMSDAGYTLSKEHNFLPKQYFLEFVLTGK
jgi:ubiquinone/menaquinone biosynthesis C-methylase UbiE